MDADEADALRPGDQVIRRVNPCTLGGFTAEVGETYTVKHSLTPVNPGLVLVEDPEGHTFSPLKFDRVEPVRTMLNLQPGDYILRLVRRVLQCAGTARDPARARRGRAEHRGPHRGPGSPIPGRVVMSAGKITVTVTDEDGTVLATVHTSKRNAERRVNNRLTDEPHLPALSLAEAALFHAAPDECPFDCDYCRS